LAKQFFRSLTLLITLNLLVKPLWILGIDRQVQNIVGHAAYGVYFALLNLTLILNILLDLGITPFFNRSVASEPNSEQELFSSAFYGKLSLTLGYSLIVLIIAVVAGIRDFGMLASLILLQILTGFNMFFRGYLSATQHFTRDAIVSVTDKFMVILFAGALILLPDRTGGITVERFVWIQIWALVLSVSLGVYFLHPKLGSLRKFSWSTMDRKILIESLPYAFNIFLMGFMSRADGFLLERIHPDGQVQAGIYAMGFRLLDAVNMVGFLFAGFLLPYIARHWPDRKSVDPVLLLCRHFLVFTSVIAASFVFAAPKWTNNLLYHDVSPYNAGVIRVVMLCLPFLSLTQIYGTLLTAVKEIGTFIRISLFFSSLNFVLNIFLIPKYGALGCAKIALCTQATNAVVLMYYSSKRTGIDLHVQQLVLYTACGALMLFSVRTFLHFDLPLIPLTSVMVTLVTIAFLKMIRFHLKSLLLLFR